MDVEKSGAALPTLTKCAYNPKPMWFHPDRVPSQRLTAQPQFNYSPSPMQQDYSSPTGDLLPTQIQRFANSDAMQISYDVGFVLIRRPPAKRPTTVGSMYWQSTKNGERSILILELPASPCGLEFSQCNLPNESNSVGILHRRHPFRTCIVSDVCRHCRTSDHPKAIGNCVRH